MISITRLVYLPSQFHLLKRMAVRRQSSFPSNREQLQAKWDDLVEKTDFWKNHGVSGLWSYYGKHYNWHGFELYPISIECSIFLFLLTLYITYGFKKVEIITDRSWEGGSREFLWHAIENRFDYEHAFSWEPFEQPKPPRLMLMRTLQKEMWTAALKRGTWFLDPQY